MATYTDEYLQPFDIRNSYVLSKVIERKKPQSELYDVAFAPLKPFRGDKVELVVKTAYGAGLAAIKADNAATPLAPFTGKAQRIFIDLVTISEKDVLDPSILKQLESQDQAVSEAAMASVVGKAMSLRARNVNRCRWMAWQAAKDALTITYPDGVSLSVDYDLDGSAMNSDFISTHQPTASSTWSAVGADIIKDLQDWTEVISNDLGIDPSETCLHVSTIMWNYMKKNTALKAELSTSQPRVITPVRDEVATILGVAAVKVSNDFYWDGNTKTKFLPDTHVLLTAYPNGKYEYNGEPLMEMYDGPVVRVVDGKIVVENNPGLIAETFVDADASAEHIRVQSSRMPVMNHPAGFLYASTVF